MLLDGLPLALELAAARVKLLPLHTLLTRLKHHRLQLLTGGTRDASERQQTLRNIVAWSYDLLDGDEQRLFRRLSVFTGGCTIYESRSSPQAFALALQNARLIVQYATCNSLLQVPAYIQRDAFMAENMAWIHDHAAGSHAKLIVWAYDTHIANNPAYFPQEAPKGTENMGGFLRKWYHDSYLTIATGLYQGVYNRYSNGYYPIPTALPGTPGKDTYNDTLGLALNCLRLNRKNSCWSQSLQASGRVKRKVEP